MSHEPCSRNAIVLRKQIKELEKKNKHLEGRNEFLKDAAAFLVASHRF